MKKYIVGLLIAISAIVMFWKTNEVDAWIKIGTYYAIYSQETQAQSVYSSDGTLVDGILDETFPIAFSATPIVLAIVKNATTAEYIYIGEVTSTAVKLYSSDGASTSMIDYIAMGDI